MPFCNRNFGEKDSVTSCAPTNSPTPIRTLGQPLIFGFETIQTIGTYIQLVTAKSMNFFQRYVKAGQWRSYAFSKWLSWILVELLHKADLYLSLLPRSLASLPYKPISHYEAS